VKGGDGIISEINAEIENAASGGALIVYTQDWHPESTPHFDKDGGRWPEENLPPLWSGRSMPFREPSS
jgi:nicotinamidase/pyrazinamidase